MKERLIRFMQGRYGVDQFSKFLVLAGLIIVILSNFIGGNILYYIGMAMAIYAYFRILSRNHQKRYKENQKYLYYVAYIKNFFNREKKNTPNGKDYHVYKCSSCKQKIRVPKGKGKIEISCPKCHKKFVKRS
jgi:DNA-directed RNA polymerase subunit RPC12/RpoP